MVGINNLIISGYGLRKVLDFSGDHIFQYVCELTRWQDDLCPWCLNLWQLLSIKPPFKISLH